ncbi:MAG: recombination protein RecR [Verrucomicrobia bacterium]|nr:MAG: recombination protein RecR [Verrucomicrobiota bacterium]
MPQSLSKVILHIIFSTKNREPWLDSAIRPHMHAYLATICRDLGSEASFVGGVTDHVHIVMTLEKTSAFRGRYHALGGRIAPLDHIGPEDLRIKELLDRIEHENFSEIIFALATDVEGEATTNYLVESLKEKPIKLTRIARGLPAGGGLESADELTLYQALTGRTQL